MVSRFALHPAWRSALAVPLLALLMALAGCDPQRIAELEEEISVLSGLTEEVEDRLDGVMGEVRAALAR